MESMSKSLEGVIVPMVTPFDDNEDVDDYLEDLLPDFDEGRN